MQAVGKSTADNLGARCRRNHPVSGAACLLASREGAAWRYTLGNGSATGSRSI